MRRYNFALKYEQLVKIRFFLPQKIKIQALKSILSARLAEGKIRVYENLFIKEPKTGLLKKFFTSAKTSSETILFVVRKNEHQNLMLAQNKITDVKFVTPNELNVMDIMRNHKVQKYMRGDGDTKQMGIIFYIDKRVWLRIMECHIIMRGSENH